MLSLFLMSNESSPVHGPLTGFPRTSMTHHDHELQRHAPKLNEKPHIRIFLFYLIGNYRANFNFMKS